MMEYVLGTPVKTLVAFSGVPLGTTGYIVEDYGSGITIAWDLPDHPYPKDIPPEEIAKMWAVNYKCPLRDGFDKESELHFLEFPPEPED